MMISTEVKCAVIVYNKLLYTIALIAALKISAKSAPECPFESGGGAKAIWAMPKCLLR